MDVPEQLEAEVISLRINNSATVTNAKSLRMLLIFVSFAVGQRKCLGGMGGDHHVKLGICKKVE